MQTILNITNIRKNYGPVCALSNVGFAVPMGSVFGILGPNGSGKTTLLAILLDVLNADGGSYNWEGYADKQDARKNIGALLETPNFFPYMSASDNLRVVALIKERGTDRIDEVLKKVKLYERRFSKFSTFSLGMKQRLAIAATLLSDPDILVLDEPTNGLDPEGIAEIRDLIISLNHDGKTIIMASHLLDEVEKVCTDVAILKKGKLLSSGSVAEVLSEEEMVEAGCEQLEKLEALLKSGLHFTIHKRQTHLLLTLPSGMTVSGLNQYCAENGIFLNHLKAHKRSLESKFIELTQ